MTEPEQKPRVIDYGNTPSSDGGWETIVVRVCAFLASAAFGFGTVYECIYWHPPSWGQSRGLGIAVTAAGSVICLLIGVFAKR